MPSPTHPLPDTDDPTDEVNPYERLMRRYAHSDEPELSIEEEMEQEGIEDADPFAAFTEVAATELVEPTTEDPAALAELSGDALEPLEADALTPLDEPAPEPTRRR